MKPETENAILAWQNSSDRELAITIAGMALALEAMSDALIDHIHPPFDGDSVKAHLAAQSTVKV